MRRIDRAVFAIFLLALVADVARSYASTPVSSELSGSLILSAASHFHADRSAGAEPGAGRNASPASFERRSHRSPVFAVWSKALLSPSAQWSQVALLPPAAIFSPPSVALPESSPASLFSSLALIERAGNPAP
ncbi:MAG TPA: hypothetical protein VIM62_11940 [Acidobacteriaceae bacterium]